MEKNHETRHDHDVHGFVISSIVGALVYSVEFVNGLASFIGLDITFSKDQTLKFPLFLNFVTAIGVLIVALNSMRNILKKIKRKINAIKESFRGTLRAGKWILNTPAATVLLLIGLFYDKYNKSFLYGFI